MKVYELLVHEQIMDTKDQEKSTTTDVDSLFRDLFSQELSTNDSQAGANDVTLKYRVNKSQRT